MKITLVGLGLSAENISEAAKDKIYSAKKLIVKTALIKPYSFFKDLPHETFDRLFEKSKNFDTLNKNIVKNLKIIAKETDVVYCVGGSVYDDTSLELLLKSYKNVEIADGESIINYCVKKTRLFGGYTAVSAYTLKNEVNDVSFPLVVYDLDSRILASEIKLKLMEKADEESELKFISDDKVKSIKLFELDRQKNYNYSTAFVLKERKLTEKTRFSFGDLVNIIKRLREKDGCPWDKVQTHETLKINAIEESYELADAIDKKDDGKIMEESGDVLLQSVFHAVIAESRGAFSTDDMISNLCYKLVFRHSHIFGKDVANNADEALSTWEKNKKEEKKFTTFSDSVKDVPLNFPALLRAEKVQKRAGKANFDFDSFNSAAEKINEELCELKNALKGDGNVKEEAGDLLFSVVNAVRKAGIESETALSESTDKFVSRFERMENAILKDGKDVTKLSAEELDGYYNAVKKD